MKTFIQKSKWFIAANCLFAMILLACGCETEQKIPAYIYISKMRLDAQGHGTDSAKLIDAWIYSNDSIVAGVRLPASTPIIGFGNTRISVLAGIAENGNFAQPAIYPFFDKYEKTLANRPGKADTLNPVFHYNSITRFVFMDEFSGLNQYEKLIDSDTSIYSASDSAPHEACGKISLDANKTLCQLKSPQIAMVTSSPAFNPSQIWVELSYRNSNTFSIGVIGTRANGQEVTTAQEKVVLSPRANWNRVYINLTQELKNMGAQNFRLIITSRKDSGVNEPFIYLDDIKVLEL